MLTMSIVNIGNMIPDDASRHAWIAAGMPTDLAVVTEICLKARATLMNGRKPPKTLKRRTAV